ncbi:MAG TPA: hypothetical protein VNF93_02330 [Buchnera sp. (in: enterobacteria)]|nr:hypothetical protein [Buchnera sp. (in: enterobacteria)]
MINCIYHPVYPMRVVDDEEYEKLLATKEWFKHPNEAKQVREKYEGQIRRDEGKRSYNRKQKTKDVSGTT